MVDDSKENVAGGGLVNNEEVVSNVDSVYEPELVLSVEESSEEYGAMVDYSGVNTMPPVKSTSASAKKTKKNSGKQPLSRYSTHVYS